MKESDSSTSKSRTDFDQILLESVNEAIGVALGKPITPQLIGTLQAYLGLSVDEMEDNVDVLFSSLRDSFGLQGADIRRLVVRRMYEKAGVPFYEVAGTHMIQYVHELRRMLAMIEYSIKPKSHAHWEDMINSKCRASYYPRAEFV